MLERIVERIAKMLPGRIAAAIDLGRPELANGFGGPFNGQARRVDAVREVIGLVPFRVCLETGTYRGTTTLFLWQELNVPVATVEAQGRYYHYAKRRFKDFPNISVMHGDSATLLHQLGETPPWNFSPAFFYLDAHWLASLPLLAELTAINNGWREYAVLIDDFQVPDDAGYAYDNYGQNGVLALPLLAPLRNTNLVVYWPAAHSSTETGARRGWVLLATDGLVDTSLRDARSLRRSGNLASTLELFAQ